LRSETRDFRPYAIALPEGGRVEARAARGRVEGPSSALVADRLALTCQLPNFARRNSGTGYIIVQRALQHAFASLTYEPWRCARDLLAMISLKEARSDVDAWLDDIKLRNGKCSNVIRNEIAEGMRQRTISAFAVYDEIGQMEGSDPPCHIGTKPAAPFKRDLAGLMHKHYKGSSLASYALNHINHWQRRKNQTEFLEIIAEFIRGGHVGKLTHGLVLGAHMGRHSAGQMTGEWIVYAPIAGINYYLTLATHKEPSAVKERVRNCFTEFPVLQTHLRW
jgi:hypothetical protein